MTVIDHKVTRRARTIADGFTQLGLSLPEDLTTSLAAATTIERALAAQEKLATRGLAVPFLAVEQVIMAISSDLAQAAQTGNDVDLAPFQRTLQETHTTAQLAEQTSLALRHAFGELRDDQGRPADPMAVMMRRGDDLNRLLHKHLQTLLGQVREAVTRLGQSPTPTLDSLNLTPAQAAAYKELRDELLPTYEHLRSTQEHLALRLEDPFYGADGPTDDPDESDQAPNHRTKPVAELRDIDTWWPGWAGMSYKPGEHQLIRIPAPWPTDRLGKLCWIATTPDLQPWVPTLNERHRELDEQIAAREARHYEAHKQATAAGAHVRV